MADEITIKVEHEEWQQYYNEPCCDPLDTDPLKEEIKTEPESPNKTVDDIQFAECWVKSEGVNISNTESPVTPANEPGSVSQKRFKCGECSYWTDKSSNFKFHLVSKHTANEPGSGSRKRFNCGECNYSTNISSNFKNHLVKHTGEQRFPCIMCNFKATRKGNLAHHLLPHGDVKPHARTMRNYRAARKITLECHMRMHTGEKPLKCHLCD